MKNNAKFLVPFLIVSFSSLIGCDKKDNRILLTYGDINIDLEDIYSNEKEYKYDLTYDELKQKIEDAQENFMVTVSTNSCACWGAFSGVISDYMKETRTICYKIKEAEFKGKDSLGLKLRTGSTSFALINEGKVAISLCSADKNTNELEDLKAFKQMMEKATILPKMYSISIDDYKEKFLDNPLNSGVVYFKRSNCGDCKKADPNILIPYFKNHLDSKRMYVVDIQPIYNNGVNKESTEYQAYIEAKIELGLANSLNIKYGFDAGVVPYFIYINHGEFTSGAVAYNDTIEKIDNKYVVTNSYYTEERKADLGYPCHVIKGLELPENDVNVSSYGISWKYEKADNYYKENISNFLDYSLSNPITILK